MRNGSVLSAERIDVKPQSFAYWTQTAALLAAFGWDVWRNRNSNGVPVLSTPQLGHSFAYWTRTAALLAAFGWDVWRNRNSIGVPVLSTPQPGHGRPNSLGVRTRHMHLKMGWKPTSKMLLVFYKRLGLSKLINLNVKKLRHLCHSFEGRYGCEGASLTGLFCWPSW